LSKTLKGVITSWNRGVQQMFGYTAEEIVGHSILTLIPAERGDLLRPRWMETQSAPAHVKPSGANFSASASMSCPRQSARRGIVKFLTLTHPQS
jgi:PAS domain S-box-containing protein